jgi:hypothetical protein
MGFTMWSIMVHIVPYATDRGYPILPQPIYCRHKRDYHRGSLCERVYCGQNREYKILHHLPYLNAGGIFPGAVPGTQAWMIGVPAR